MKKFLCLAILAIGCSTPAPAVPGAPPGFSTNIPDEVLDALEAGAMPTPLDDGGQALTLEGTFSSSLYTTSTFDSLTYKLKPETILKMTEECPSKLRIKASGSQYTYVGSTNDGEIDGASYIRLTSSQGGSMWIKATSNIKASHQRVPSKDTDEFVNVVMLEGEVAHPIPNHAEIKARLGAWSTSPCQ